MSRYGFWVGIGLLLADAVWCASLGRWWLVAMTLSLALLLVIAWVRVRLGARAAERELRRLIGNGYPPL